MTILRALYERWNAHDVDGVLAFFATDMIYRDQAMGFEFSGPAELGQFMQASFVAIPDLRFAVTSSFETSAHFGGEALMSGTFQYDLPGVQATGRNFDVHYGIIGDHRDGKITRIVDYWNATEFTS
ncbi:MAG TPA: ester cyclase [Trebonia sp.]|jgi:steroid delta-isomerase-like uncharacterized protein|nr:ester cyclase [Trebonia sp.]